MKRDKKWAKEQLEDYIKAIGNPFNNRTRAMINAYENVEHIINQLDEPSEVEPLVVPKYLGDWLSKQTLGNEDILFRMIIELKDMWVEDGYENFITNNKKQLIQVILGTRPYEVVKEKLYQIELPSGHVMYVSGTKDKPSYSYITKGLADKTRKLFTEEEIKSIDERLWHFAVEVTE